MKNAERRAEGAQPTVENPLSSPLLGSETHSVCRSGCLVSSRPSFTLLSRPNWIWKLINKFSFASSLTRYQPTTAYFSIHPSPPGQDHAEAKVTKYCKYGSSQDWQMQPLSGLPDTHGTPATPACKCVQAGLRI